MTQDSNLTREEQEFISAQQASYKAVILQPAELAGMKVVRGRAEQLGNVLLGFMPKAKVYEGGNVHSTDFAKFEVEVGIMLTEDLPLDQPITTQQLQKSSKLVIALELLDKPSAPDLPLAAALEENACFNSCQIIGEFPFTELSPDMVFTFRDPEGEEFGNPYAVSVLKEGDPWYIGKEALRVMSDLNVQDSLSEGTLIITGGIADSGDYTERPDSLSLEIRKGESLKKFAINFS